MYIEDSANHLAKTVNTQIRISRLLLFAFIAILALFFRVRNLGEDPFFQDQAATSMGALQVLEGKWPLVGPLSFSFSSIMKDPPLPSYIYAVPFSISRDPRIARIFTALWNLIAIALAYKIGERYFSYKAGLLAAMLYAIHPTAVIASRFIWNPNLPAPFVMLYIYTGLLGYYESKTLPRIFHMPILALAILCHPALVLLLPVTIIFWLHKWCQNSGRRILLIHTFSSTAIAVCLMLPWVVGNFQLVSNASSDQNTNLVLQSIDLTTPNTEVINTVLSGRGCWRNNCPMLLGDRPKLFLTHLLPAITVMAALWTIFLGITNNRSIPVLTLTVGFFVVPLIASSIDRLFDHYVWPLIGNAVLIQAAVIYSYPHNNKVKLIKHPFLDAIQRYIPVVYLLPICIVITGQIWFNIRYDPKENLPSLNENIDAIRYARNATKNAAAELILQDYQPSNELRCQGCRGWETLPTLFGDNLRTLPQDSGVPVPKIGSYILRSASWPKDTVGFGEKQSINKWFDLIRYNPSEDTTITIANPRPVKFENGVKILGINAPENSPTPKPGQHWKPTLIWEAGNSNLGSYKFFLHLLDSDGNKYGQHDPMTLPGQLWKSGEIVLNNLDFNVGTDLPENAAIFVKLGMYDEIGKTKLLDVPGLPQMDHQIIQIQGLGLNNLYLDEFYTLDTLDHVKQQKQGNPLEIKATWLISERAPTIPELIFSLYSESGDLTYKTNMNLTKNTTVLLLAAKTYLSETYVLPIPTTLETGKYKIEITAANNDVIQNSKFFSSNIQITHRERNFDVPDMQHSLNTTFGNLLSLVGYNLHYEDKLLNILLHWKSINHIPINYKYFVHIVRNNQVYAQIDTMPNNYQYPTSWWAPNEILTDMVTLDTSDLMPGDYTITVGLYDPTDKSRLYITDHNHNILNVDHLAIHQLNILP